MAVMLYIHRMQHALLADRHRTPQSLYCSYSHISIYPLIATFYCPTYCYIANFPCTALHPFMLYSHSLLCISGALLASEWLNNETSLGRSHSPVSKVGIQSLTTDMQESSHGCRSVPLHRCDRYNIYGKQNACDENICEIRDALTDDSV